MDESQLQVVSEIINWFTLIFKNIVDIGIEINLDSQNALQNQQLQDYLFALVSYFKVQNSKRIKWYIRRISAQA